MKTRRSFKGGWQFFTAATLVGAALVASAPRPYAAGQAQTSGGTQAAAAIAGPEQPAAEAPKPVRIDLNKAVNVSLPRPGHDLQPAAFKTADGREGWVVRIPGGRPLATPAYANGHLFVGGGYGSHEFYAFDAKTGRMVWKTNTGDDGPTAAVVEGGLVAFNTESCTLVVVDEQTGKMVWQEWLGDPLMSQPAVSKGRLYMAYPGNGGGHAQNVAPHAVQSAAMMHGVPKPVQSAQQKEGQQTEEVGSHRLLCADLKTGRHIWEHAISSDVISAPVVS
jgi:Ca-activated chloride channel family protein